MKQSLMVFYSEVARTSSLIEINEQRNKFYEISIPVKCDTTATVVATSEIDAINTMLKVMKDKKTRLEYLNHSAHWFTDDRFTDVSDAFDWHIHESDSFEVDENDEVVMTKAMKEKCA